MGDKRRLKIEVDSMGKTQVIELNLSRSGCWSHFLGQWELPCAGAIDEMAGLFDGSKIDRVRLYGCPSACLLPILWMKTIWLVDSCPEIHVHWDDVQDPANEPGRQPAARLSCLLADEVVCTQTDAAWKLWGIRKDVSGELHEEAFDLLSNLVDLWDTDLQGARVGVDWNDSVQHALMTCSTRGYRRIGIYGAGTHTRAVGDALREPSVEIACIIDDDARRHGDQMWGYEIVSREQALGMGLDAVVISANSIEDHLWDRCGVFRECGVSTIRLYGVGAVSDAVVQ